MARLYRPHIPIQVKCLVGLRQTGWQTPSAIAMLFRLHKGHLGKLLDSILIELAAKLGCKVHELRLDHDPPLALRKRRLYGYPQTACCYVPDANDPDHLRYRPHGAEHDGSHDVKTRVRGDHGQYSDLALIRREKRRTAKTTTKYNRKNNRRPKIRSRGFDKAKRKMRSRPFQRRKS